MGLDMVTKRVNLLDLCGGETEAKADFLRRMNTINLSPEVFDSVLLAWNDGFVSCIDLIMDAIHEGKVQVQFTDETGQVWDFLAP